MTKEKLIETVSTEVDNTVDQLFINIHQLAKTKYGDTTAEQDEQLEMIRENLKNLIVEQVWQNL